MPPPPALIMTLRRDPRYATAMQDYDLPQIATDELIRLSRQVGTPIEDCLEFQILWDGV